MDKIKVAVLGYGNLGKGVERCLSETEDMELAAIFSKRGAEIKPATKTPVFKADDLQNFKDKIDVMIICGGSATDLPTQSPQVLSMFNCVDSFDNHLKITEHFEALNKVGRISKKLIAISAGWDPGLFSMAKLLFSSIMPKGKTYTFWGEGVSQGHSEAIRSIEGVEYAVQYTVPKKEALDKVRKGTNPELSTFDKHIRECFIVPIEGADLTKIEQKIKNMPNYFKGYDTIIHFISEEEFKAKHTKMPHGGAVIHSDIDGSDKFFMELSLKLGSNPKFTAAVLVAYARAVYKLNKEGKCGAVTVLDIPLAYLSPKSELELYKDYL